MAKKPTFYVAGSKTGPPTPEEIFALVRALSGQEPTDEERATILSEYDDLIHGRPVPIEDDDVDLVSANTPLTSGMSREAPPTVDNGPTAEATLPEDRKPRLRRQPQSGQRQGQHPTRSQPVRRKTRTRTRKVRG